MMTGTCTIACLLATVATGAAPEAPGEVVPLNQRAFDIPIRVLPNKRAEIHTLELYQSTDGGRSWQLAGRAAPDQPAFKVTVRADGKYLYSVQVIDRRGRREPPDLRGAPPGQVLLIDTLKPDVRLRAERKGEVVEVRWEVREENPGLARDRFKLEYVAAAGPAKEIPASPSATGQATFRAGNEAVTVRMRVSDAAGNVGQAEAQVPASGVLTASAREPAGGIGLESPPPLPSPADNLPPPPSLSPPGSEDPPPPVTPEPKHAAELQPVEARNARQKPPLATAEPVGEADTVDKGPAPPPHLPGLPGGGDPPPTVAASPNPGVTPPAGSDRGGADGGLLVVNNRRVTLEYEVANFGPSGIGTVDVYVTRDGGRSWQKFNGELNVAPAPPEMASPSARVMRRTLTVHLTDDGMYGFYLVVKSGAGLSKPAPRGGTLPQMQLKLDTVLPKAVLYQPEPDAAQRDALVISWKASDDHLTDTPVTIQWAEKPAGPWQPIGEHEMANGGSHSWRVPANVPPKVYLRLTVRDRAGNVAVAETKEPVLVDLHTPEVRILGLKRGGQ